MNTLFDRVSARSTVGTLLRESTFGHARQLESVVREHLVALCERTDLLPWAHEQMFIDSDSLLRPVYGHAKQRASYGHTKIATMTVIMKRCARPSPMVAWWPSSKAERGHDQVFAGF